MSKLEAGCKAFIINDPFVPENNWKVVELKELVKAEYDTQDREYFIDNDHNMYRTILPSFGFYWKVEGELLTEDISHQIIMEDSIRYYRPEQLMPLKGDFKLEQQTTENTLSCLSH